MIEWLIALILAICSMAQAHAPAERLTPSVVVVGDSITALQDGIVRGVLQGCGTNPDIHAQGGRRVLVEQTGFQGETITPAEQVISMLLLDGRDPDVWIIEVGTNEVWTPLSPAQADARIARIEALLDGKRTIWTDVNIGGGLTEGYPGSVERAAVWNAALDRSGVEQVDWSGVGTSALYDGVHADANGAARLAGLWCAAIGA